MDWKAAAILVSVLLLASFVVYKLLPTPGPVLMDLTIHAYCGDTPAPEGATEPDLLDVVGHFASQ